MMKCDFLKSFTTVALSAGAILFLPAIGASQTPPPIGGGYPDAIPIPVDDPTTKNIAGALFKPGGAGPFPAVIYMSGCSGLDNSPEFALEQSVVDHLLAKGLAVLIVDPFTPRNEAHGVCKELNAQTFVHYATRGGNDATAAAKALEAMPDIDPNHVFLQGYSFGAISSLFATDLRAPTTLRLPGSSPTIPTATTTSNSQSRPSF
jgi:dienelactone hydrolase